MAGTAAAMQATAARLDATSCRWVCCGVVWYILLRYVVVWCIVPVCYTYLTLPTNREVGVPV